MRCCTEPRSAAALPLPLQRKIVAQTANGRRCTGGTRLHLANARRAGIILLWAPPRKSRSRRATRTRQERPWALSECFVQSHLTISFVKGRPIRTSKAFLECTAALTDNYKDLTPLGPVVSLQITSYKRYSLHEKKNEVCLLVCTVTISKARKNLLFHRSEYATSV